MRKKDKIIGICVARLGSDHPGHYVQALCRQAREQGYKVFIFNVFKQLDYMNSFLEGEISIFDRVPFDKLSVLVLCTESLLNREVTLKLANRAHEAGVPVISVDARLEDCHNVLFAYEESFERIVRHIVEQHGCKKINFMAGFENNSFSDARMEIFRKVLEQNDIPVEESRLAYGQFWEMPARIACEKWVTMWQLGKQDMPDAIVCANDMMALTVCNVLTNHGIRVPEDILLTGFDGLGLERYCTPRLTTARDDIELIGAEFMKLIDKCVNEKDFPLTDVRIHFQTVFSESCGCVPIQSCNPNEQIMELYGNAAEMHIQSSETFFMMSVLTEGYSAVEMAKNLWKYKDIIHVDSMMMFLNRSFCEQTDIPCAGFAKDSLSLFVQIRDGEYTIPMTEVRSGEEFELLGRMAEEVGEILIIPLHQQVDSFGFLAVAYQDCESKGGADTGIGEFYEFVLCINQMLGTIRKQSQLHRMYITDNMTKLYNRRGFYGQLKRQLQELKRKEKILFLASVDMDGLKYINDNFGHLEGDNGIKKVARMLKESLEGRNGICARFGGDEFMVAIVSSVVEADITFYKNYEAKLQKRVEEFGKRSKKPYPISVSVGCIYETIKGISDVDRLMKKADDMMYSCKRKHHSKGIRVRESSRG